MVKEQATKVRQFGWAIVLGGLRLPVVLLTVVIFTAAVVFSGCHREPDLAQLSHDLAAILDGSGPEEVLARTKYEVELNPSAETYERLAQAYALTQQTEEVVKALEKALELDPTYPRALLGMAVVNLRQGHFAEAQSIAGQLLDDKQCGPSEVQTVVSRALLGQKKLQEAADLASTGIKQHPRYAPLHYVLGDAHMSLTQLDEAVIAYQKAVQIQPEERMYRQAVILALLMDKRTDEAVREAKSAQQAVRDSAPLQFLVGTVYSAAGDTQSAIAAYEEALLIDPHMAPAANNLAQTLADLDEQLVRAEELATRALRHDLKNSAYADTLGWVWVRSGQYGKAIELLEKVLEQWPESVSTKYHLGYALAKSGQIQRGQALLNEAAQAQNRPDIAQAASDALRSID
jgi:tetratricopeptide (TPR) repeat protein